MPRYIVRIQNPRFDLSVFVWDTIDRIEVVSYPYNEQTIAAQEWAKAKCYKYIEDYLSVG